VKHDAHNGELKSVLHMCGNGYLPNWKTNLRRINSFACVCVFFFFFLSVFLKCHTFWFLIAGNLIHVGGGIF